MLVFCRWEMGLTILKHLVKNKLIKVNFVCLRLIPDLKIYKFCKTQNKTSSC